MVGASKVAAELSENSGDNNFVGTEANSGQYAPIGSTHISMVSSQSEKRRTVPRAIDSENKKVSNRNLTSSSSDAKGKKAPENTTNDDISDAGIVVGCWRIVPRYVDLSLPSIDREAIDRAQKDILKHICRSFYDQEQSRSHHENNHHDQPDHDKFTFALHNEVYQVMYKIEYLSEERNSTLILTLSGVTLERVVSSDSRPAPNSRSGAYSQGNTDPHEQQDHKNEKFKKSLNAAIFPNDDVVWEIVHRLTKCCPQDFPWIVDISEESKTAHPPSPTNSRALSKRLRPLSGNKHVPSTTTLCTPGGDKLESVLKAVGSTSFMDALNGGSMKTPEIQAALKFLKLFTIEVAPDHYARYLSPRGQLFCDWIHSNIYVRSHQNDPKDNKHKEDEKHLTRPEYPTKALYQIAHPKSLTDMKCTCVHVIHRSEKSPLLAVAWVFKKDNVSVNKLAVYKLYTGKLIFEVDQSMSNPFLQEIKAIASTFRVLNGHFRSCLVLIVGFADGSVATVPVTRMDHSELSKREVVGESGNVEYAVNAKSLILKVHPESINAIHVSGDYVYTASNDRSFCVLKWETIRAINDAQNPTEEEYVDVLQVHSYSIDHIINDVPKLIGIQLSIASLPREDDAYFGAGDRVTEDIFTTGWQDIRYWKQHDDLKWTSHLFQNGHVKKVSCMDVYDFSASDFAEKLQQHYRTINSMPCRKHKTSVRGEEAKRIEMNLYVAKEQYEEHHSFRAPYNVYRGRCRHSDNPCRVLVSGSVDKTAIVWDITDPMNPMKVRQLEGHENEVTSVKILPMDDISPMVITASSADNTIRCWDLLSGTIFRKLKANGDIKSLDTLRINDRYGMTGDMIVTSEGGQVYVRNFLNNHREMCQYSDAVLAIATCPTSSSSTTERPISISQVAKQNCAPIAFGTSNGACVISVNGRVVDTLMHNPEELVLLEDKEKKVEIDSRLNAFQFDPFITTNKNIVKTDRKKEGSHRVNAVITFSEKLLNDSKKEMHYIVTGLACGMVVVWESNADEINYTRRSWFRGDSATVFTLACYDPDLDMNRSNTDRFLLFVGGLGKDFKIWNFADIQNEKGFIASADKLKSTSPALKSTHSASVRSIVVHYPTSKDLPTLFLTGAYDKKTIIWDLKTQLPLMELIGLHKQFILAIEVYDPTIRQFKQEEEEFISKGTTVTNLANKLVVITGGYDGRIGLWTVDKNEIRELSRMAMHGIVEKGPNGKPTMPRTISDSLKMNHDKFESVTALALHVPKPPSKQSPLIITGSIDNLIYIWSLYSQERIQIVTGHSNRVNYFNLYTRPSSTAYSNHEELVLLSGGDDGNLIFWEDALDYQPPPLSKHQVIRSFYKDVHINDNAEPWKLMTLLKDTHPHLFIEFPFLFYLALIEKKETFFVTFEDSLKEVIARIPSFKCSRTPECDHRVDILEYAIETHSLVALRAILVSWSYALNQDITDSLAQKRLVATHAFNEDTLIELARSFPVEYTDFLNSLALVRNHATTDCLKSNLFTVIPDGKRTMYIGSRAVKKAGDKSALSSNSTCVMDDIYWALHRAMRFFQYIPPALDQPVMPFSTPIRRFATIQQFAAMIETSEVIDNLIVFDSPIVDAAIKHFWEVYGWKIHAVALIQYVVTIVLFVASIYLFPSPSDPYNGLRFRQTQRANVLFMLMMVGYAVDEVCQLIAKCYLLHRSRLNASLFLQLSFDHFLGDVWNMIDAAVICTGFSGVYMRFSILSKCVEAHICHDEPYQARTTTSNCILAITAVMLWFKILYFLRPSKAAGQFVAMVITILKDIKYFLFVLACVLTGFAQGFWLIFNESNQATSSFRSVKMSYFSTFMYMFGNMDTDDLDGAGSRSFAMLFLVAFMLTMMILMLNLLIALMGDSFARTKENIHRIYRKELASFMIDQAMPTPLLYLLSSSPILLNLDMLQYYHEDDLIFVIKYTSDLRHSTNNDSNSDDSNSNQTNRGDVSSDTTSRPNKTALEEALEVCKAVMKVSPENIANAPKKPREDDIIDR